MIQLDNSATEAEVKTADDTGRIDMPATPRIPPLDLQPVGGPDEARGCQLDELLRYHDRKFVAHVYVALRNRAPTPAELAEAVDELRSGRRTKTEIIENLSTA